MSLALYKTYLQDCLGHDCIESRDGFITYVIIPSTKTLHLWDAYIDPSVRGSGAYALLFNNLVELAKLNELHSITGYIFTSYRNKEQSMRAHLKLGCKILATDTEKITMIKEVL